ncbi:MAG: response regulator [Nitrospirae bacterium]|nr:MAG: response regulator [Nitrospirota bacterium]
MNRKINILLVDDEQDFLETTTKRLARRGYDVRSAMNCSDAIRIVGDGWPEVVVLDVMLPDRDGIQCLKEIKQKWPSVVVILLTGHASMQAGRQCLEYGANDYCLKPIELDELVEKIKIALKNA